MRQEPLWRPTVQDAAVLVLDRLEHPLWDCRAAGLVESVEERLGGVFVTSIALGAGRPHLQDALRAARFVGSRSAHVVVRDEATARRIVGRSGEIPYQVVVAPDWTPDAIAATIRAAGDEAERRACA